VNNIARMAANQRADLFGETANRMGLSGAVVEKDFWVCAINRFSEDIDLAVDYAALGFTGPRDPRRQGLSRTKQTKLLGEMLRDCQRYIGSEFIREFRTRCEAVLGRDGIWSCLLYTSGSGSPPGCRPLRTT